MTNALRKYTRFADYDEAYKSIQIICGYEHLDYSFEHTDYDKPFITLKVWFNIRDDNPMEFHAKTKKRCIEKAFEYYGWNI